ncbi:MAG: histidine kinase dimerization/phospho-acceptor domain-containing protein, partial [Anaerovoracaceae bacterium]
MDFLNFQELFNPELYLPTRQAVIVIAAYSFLKGTFHFFQAKLSRIVLGVVILSLISIGLSGIFPEIYNMAIIPNIICSSSLLIGAGCMFISYSWTENLPEKIGASFLIILWALFVNHFGFTITHRGIAIGTYFIGIFIITLLILLLMIIHFKKLRFLDQKQASRFRLLVENSSDCMFLYDYRSFSFEYASGSIGELIGTSRKTLYADPEAFFEFLTAEDGDSTIFSIFKQPLLRPCSNVLSYRSEEGLVKWVEIHCLPIIDPLGNVSAVEGILRDITKPREMMIQLAETEEEKKNLIENISHEIRTPITLIQGYAESLMDEIVPKDAYPTYLKMMHSKALMLNTLLEDLIRVSTFTSQELEYKFYETSVKKYFDNVIAQCKFQIEQSGHFFQGECQLKENIMMIIDEQRILQVISNMTNNAIRHTPKFSLIQVRCISIPTKE